MAGARNDNVTAHDDSRNETSMVNRNPSLNIRHNNFKSATNKNNRQNFVSSVTRASRKKLFAEKEVDRRDREASQKWEK